jgi:hypothetical protein
MPNATLVDRILNCNWYSDNGDVACFTDGATYTDWRPINILLVAVSDSVDLGATPTVDLGDVARHNIYCLDAYTARRAADLNLRCLDGRPGRVDLIVIVKDGVDNLGFAIIP